MAGRETKTGTFWEGTKSRCPIEENVTDAYYDCLLGIMCGCIAAVKAIQVELHADEYPA